MYSNDGFADQELIEVNLCGYALLFPSQHPLLSFLNPSSSAYQPYRESGLMKVVHTLHQQKPSGVAIDIGANVGDTCAIIHKFSAMKIVSIDASDFFFKVLEKNIARNFSDRAEARQAFIVPSPDTPLKGLYHWGGTAKVVEAPFTENCSAITIQDLLNEFPDVSLFKIDIDGFDMDVISTLLDLLQTDFAHRRRFPLYFEYEFRGETPEDIGRYCVATFDVFRKASAAGYRHAFLWDDPGRFFGRINLEDERSLKNAINYMGHFRHRPLWGFDICLMHQSDRVLADELGKIISADAIFPVAEDCR